MLPQPESDIEHALPARVIEPIVAATVFGVFQERTASHRRDELFNLREDPAETSNLIAANRELAARLKKLLVESRDWGFTRPEGGS